MAFIITVDHINDGEFNGYTHPKTDAPLEKCVIPFRMYDDDDELYYEGLGNNSNSFQPLDLFGTPNDGCTWIEYFENGKWEQL